ncbi:MAG: 4a-hydroxytetrahydrobiopterin dehydratase [Acidobacteriota bacterium]|nr:MAG: 4a-hydroxytetrahydrobiopterin dehydratase [Acidobacteriota bacterium]
MTSDLTRKKCVPCEGGIPALNGEEIRTYQDRISSVWTVEEDHHLRARFSFRDFAQALSFTNQVGALAEVEGHHPDIYLSWGLVEIKLWTHAVDGLTENDFILAAKIDQL